MGTDAKLMIKSTGDKMYIDRKYNIKNNILELSGLDYWVCTHGLPVFLMRESVIQMRDMFVGEEGTYKFYKDILEWIDKYDDFDYVRLVDEHDDDYAN